MRCSSGKTFTPDLLIEDNLVVEVLGSIHWKAKVRTKDIVRSEALRASGFEVLEVLNDEVFRDVRKVADLIQVELVNLRGGA